MTRLDLIKFRKGLQSIARFCFHVGGPRTTCCCSPAGTDRSQFLDGRVGGRPHGPANATTLCCNVMVGHPTEPFPNFIASITGPDEVRVSVDQPWHNGPGTDVHELQIMITFSLRSNSSTKFLMVEWI